MVKRAGMFLLLCCLAFGCTHSHESKIAGKWACRATGDRMDLSEDHTCTVFSMGFHYSGRWSLSKTDIKIEADQIALKGAFDGKNLVVEDGNMHNTYVFEKIAEAKTGASL